MEETYEAIVEALINYPRYRKNPEFKTVKALLNQVGYKERCPVIHVAGTNGKGSVVSMLSEIIQATGKSVGIFTSPHLIDIRERMQVNGKLMTKGEFRYLYYELNEAIEVITTKGYDKPTFFEMLFVLAMMYFNKNELDVIIIETGIGGRVDTTNVLENKLLTIIVSIGYDHMNILGNSLESIAKEKVGIIRPNVPLVFYNENKVVCSVIEEECHEKKTKLIKVLPTYHKILKRNKESIDFSLENKYYEYEMIRMRAFADYQIINAKIAVTSARELSEYFGINSEHIKKGLWNFTWPGRMEYMTPFILVDGAHNIDGINAFVNHIKKYENNKIIDLLFVCMSDKKVDDMIKALLSIEKLRNVYIPAFNLGKAIEMEKLVKKFKQSGFERVRSVKRIEAFIKERHCDTRDDVLLSCVGSLYLVGEVKKYRGGLNHD